MNELGLFLFALLVMLGLLFLVTILVFVVVLQYKRKYPEKSYTIATLNVALTPLRMFNIGPYKYGEITIEKVMKLVSRETKLNDFGDLAFVERYRFVNTLPSFKEHQLTNLGYIMAITELRMMISRRLKLVDYLKNNPVVLQISAADPVFVFGLGRSGTTFLHRLLSLDPTVRSPKLWELVNPVPEVKDGAPQVLFDADCEKRKEFVRKRIEERKLMGDDGLEKYHEVGHDLPEECLFGLSDEIPTTFHYLYFTITNWFELRSKKIINAEDLVQAYLYYKRLLQLLSFQIGDTKGEKRWVLKCPMHVFMIQQLAIAFPDAKLVWAHRHPQPTVSSLCSLLYTMRGIYFDNAKLEKKIVGEKMLNIAEKCLTQAPKDIEKSGLPCAHVLYENLVADPVGTVKKVYDELGFDYTPAYDSALQSYLEENRRQREETKAMLAKKTGQKKAVLHEHRPEDFGIPATALNEGVFADYIKRYNIKSDK
ncbi:sulfotransferase [archaeon]|nr:MAG: sulfotransferase [archaeon]